MKPLRLSASARDDLLEIAGYIARDNPKRARSFVVELREQCAKLAQHPEMGVAKQELAEGLRMFPYGRYLLFFSVTDSETILIERVLHSAGHISSLFSKP